MRRGRQMLYILPNLFTFSSVFCGLLSIHWSTTGTEPAAFYRAALAILFAAVFDMMDGRMARLTRTESEIGEQLDSLADVVSFGVAPAMLMYNWGLQGIQAGVIDVGFVLCFLYVVAGAFRLARFNVLAARARRVGAEAAESHSRYFVGLPIPVGACMMAGIVFAHHQTDAALLQKRFLLLALVPLLAWLMVSPVRFRTFKKLHITRRHVLAIVAAVAMCAFVTARTAPAVTLLSILSVYVFLGLAEYAIATPRRIVHRISSRRRAAAALLVDDDLVDAEDTEDELEGEGDGR